MKFNYIIGNPPYQDGTVLHSQNKIYNLISKKCLNLLTDDGIINFITPIAVTRPSKRFHISGTPGLKSIDFSINEYFNVGVGICNWILDKLYTGNDVEIIDYNRRYFVKNTDLILRGNEEENFKITLFYKLKENAVQDRMFQKNTYNSQQKSLIKTTEHIYSLFNGESYLYVKKRPHFYREDKLIFSYAKAFKDENMFISKTDYSVPYICTSIKNEEEVENIKTFLFSDYFLDYMKVVKDFQQTASYEILQYLPVFDKTKKWTNDEVKEFFKGLV